MFGLFRLICVFGPETLFEFVGLSDPRISENGEWCSYVLSKPDLAADKYNQTLVVKSLVSGEERFVDKGYMQRFSPDSKHLSYAIQSDSPGKSELWVMDIATGSSRKMLEVEGLVDVLWSPNGEKLCLVLSKKRNDSHLYFEEDVPIWFNSKGFLDSEKAEFKIVDSGSGALLERFEENVPLLPLASVALWHGESLIINAISLENPFTMFTVYIHEAGVSRVLFKDVSYVAVDSDGQNLVLLGKPKKVQHAEHSYVYVWNGNSIVALTEKYGWNNSWAPPKLGGGYVYYVSAEEGRLALNRVSLDGATQESLIHSDCWVTLFDVSQEGKVVYVKESPTQPAELYLWDKAESKITSYNAGLADRLGLKPFNPIKYKSVGGLEIDGWYLKPEDGSGRAPLVVFIHGGPKGMYGYRFDFLGQLLARTGYYVLYTNPRGSDGYDEDFALRIMHRYGEEDFQDIMNGINQLTKMEERVNPERVGVTGISGGGYLTNWAVTHTSTFKAAISENGISNWFTMYTYSDIGYWFCKDLIGEDPLQSEEYRRLSPIYLARNVNTPILFIHSTEDYRCPLEQSVSFHQLLKTLHKESYIAVFKKGDHVHSLNGSPKHRLKRLKLIQQFFDTKLVRQEEGFKPEFADTVKTPQ
ncbi:MAG: S9 family peptidase [Thermoprotei archaeon]